MPEHIEVGQTTPGNHPDASPGHAMERNTNEMRRMAGIVAGHDANMQAHSELLRKNITCTEELISATTALINAVNENSTLIRLQGDQVQGSRDDMARLRESLETVSEHLRQHTPEVIANTAAMTALKRTM